MRKITQNKDIFARTHYYQNTVLFPEEIVERLGHKGLSRRDNYFPTSKTKKEELYPFPDDVMVKTIINKRGMDSEDMLEIEDNCRKNIYANGQNFSYFQQRQKQHNSLKKQYRWFENDEVLGDTKILKFAEILAYMPRSHFTYIDDYTLTNYCYFLQCQNDTYGSRLYEFLDNEFAEYPIKAHHIDNPKHSKKNKQPWIIHPRVNVEDRDSVLELISKIQTINKNSDLLYAGLHMFIGMAKLQIRLDDYSQQQLGYLKYLQYYLVMISGLLANQQNAIIKIYSNLKHKTNEYIFLLRTMFTKISIVKPMLSNHFGHQKYILCQGFKKSVGIRIYEHLMTNFDLLRKYGQEKFLVKSKIIFKNEFVTLITDYNNRLINKGYKTLYQKYDENNAIKYMPCQKYLREKMKHSYILKPTHADMYLNILFKTQIQVQKMEIQQEEKKILQDQKLEKNKVLQAGEVQSKYSLSSLLAQQKPIKKTEKQKEKEKEKQKKSKQQQPIKNISCLFQTLEEREKEKKNKNKKPKRDRERD